MNSRKERQRRLKAAKEKAGAISGEITTDNKALKRQIVLMDAFKLVSEVKEVWFFDEIPALLGVGRGLLYDVLPPGSEQREKINDMLLRNRITCHVEMRKKLLSSNKGADIERLYKSTSTEEERKLLTANNVVFNAKSGDISAEAEKEATNIVIVAPAEYNKIAQEVGNVLKNDNE